VKRSDLVRGGPVEDRAGSEPATAKILDVKGTEFTAVDTMTTLLEGSGASGVTIAARLFNERQQVSRSSL